MWAALGAFEDDGTLVGVLAVTGVGGVVGTVHLVVTPERRRLKIGTDLAEIFAVDHLPGLGAPVRPCSALDERAAMTVRVALGRSLAESSRATGLDVATNLARVSRPATKARPVLGPPSPRAYGGEKRM